MSPATRSWWLYGIAGIFVVGAVWMVVASLERPSPPTFVPDGTIERNGDVRRVTLDARDPDRWTYMDLERDSVLGHRRVEGWDLAVRRFHVILNGGAGFEGEAAATELGDRPVASVREIPEGELVGTGREGSEPRHPLLAEWYRYDFFSHLLLARPVTYGVRTAEGERVALRFLSYYCPGPEAGCVTLTYRPVPAEATAER